MSTNAVILQIQAAKLDARVLLRADAVSTLTGLSRSALYGKVESGELAAPLRMGNRCTRWVAADVFAFLDRKNEEAHTGPSAPSETAAAPQVPAKPKKSPGGAAGRAGKASA